MMFSGINFRHWRGGLGLWKSGKVRSCRGISEAVAKARISRIGYLWPGEAAPRYEASPRRVFPQVVTPRTALETNKRRRRRWSQLHTWWIPTTYVVIK